MKKCNKKKRDNNSFEFFRAKQLRLENDRLREEILEMKRKKNEEENLKVDLLRKEVELLRKEVEDLRFEKHFDILTF